MPRPQLSKEEFLAKMKAGKERARKEREAGIRPAKKTKRGKKGKYSKDEASFIVAHEKPIKKVAKSKSSKDVVKVVDEHGPSVLSALSLVDEKESKGMRGGKITLDDVGHGLIDVAKIAVPLIPKLLPLVL